MASALGSMVLGAVVNAFAFSGSNFLFSLIGKKGDIDEERKRHDKAEEDLAKATDEWNKRRTERLDFLRERNEKEAHSVKAFDDAGESMKEYYYVTGGDKNTTTQEPEPEGRKPTLSDFYPPSEEQKNREYVFIVLGMIVTGFVAWKIHKIETK